MEVKAPPEGVQNDEFEAINSTDVQDRFKVLTVKAGFAKGGYIGLDKVGYDDARVEKLKEELASLGLSFVAELGTDNHVVISYSANKKDLDGFLKAHELAGEDTEQIHKINGKFYGTPQTAIDAYIGNTQITYFDFPEDVLANPLSRLIHFAMSKEHIKEEWKKYVENANQTAKKFPDLIQKFGLTSYFS